MSTYLFIKDCASSLVSILLGFPQTVQNKKKCFEEESQGFFANGNPIVNPEGSYTNICSLSLLQLSQILLILFESFTS